MAEAFKLKATKVTHQQGCDTEFFFFFFFFFFFECVFRVFLSILDANDALLLVYSNFCDDK